MGKKGIERRPRGCPQRVEDDDEGILNSLELYMWRQYQKAVFAFSWTRITNIRFDFMNIQGVSLGFCLSEPERQEPVMGGRKLVTNRKLR